MLSYAPPFLCMWCTARLPGTKEWRTLDRYSAASAPPNIHVLRLDEALTFVNVDYVKVRPQHSTAHMKHTYIA